MSEKEIITKAAEVLIEQVKNAKDAPVDEAKLYTSMSTDAWTMRIHTICKWIWKIVLVIGGAVDVGLLILSF